MRRQREALYNWIAFFWFFQNCFGQDKVGFLMYTDINMINQHFVIVGALFNLVGSATYAFNTIKGKTKPNRVTWFLWALAPLIAFAAQLNEGVTWAALMTFMVGFGPLIIFISSFVNRKAYWKITKLDIVCGGYRS